MLINIFNHKIYKSKNTFGNIVLSNIAANNIELSNINGCFVSPLNDNFKVNDWFKLYKENIDEMKQEFGISGHPILHDMWCYCYNKEVALAKHNHGEDKFIGIHYLKYNKMIHHPTRFYQDSSERYTDLDVDENDIIIFPSHIYHEARANKSIEQRMVVAFSCYFT